MELVPNLWSLDKSKLDGFFFAIPELGRYVYVGWEFPLLEYQCPSSIHKIDTLVMEKRFKMWKKNRTDSWTPDNGFIYISAQVRWILIYEIKNMYHRYLLSETLMLLFYWAVILGRWEIRTMYNCQFDGLERRGSRDWFCWCDTLIIMDLYSLDQD
jgi:hypothetical protein